MHVVAFVSAEADVKVLDQHPTSPSTSLLVFENGEDAVLSTVDDNKLDSEVSSSFSSFSPSIYYNPSPEVVITELNKIPFSSSFTSSTSSSSFSSSLVSDSISYPLTSAYSEMIYENLKSTTTYGECNYNNYAYLYMYIIYI